MVSCDEVRARLQKAEAELSDTILNSAAFIPVGEAWFAKYFTYASLSTTDQALAKAAVIAKVCARVISLGPQAGSKWGPMEVKELKADDQNKAVEAFEKEAIGFMKELGAVIGSGRFHVCGQGYEDYNTEAESVRDDLV